MTQLEVIAELARLLEQAALEYWLFGGWATDFTLGRLTRLHDDIDVFVFERDRRRIADLLRSHAYEYDPQSAGPFQEGVACFRKCGHAIGLAMIRIEEDGGYRFPGKLRDPDWPVAGFRGVDRTLNGVRCRVIPAEDLVYMLTRFREKIIKREMAQKHKDDLAALLGVQQNDCPTT